MMYKIDIFKRYNDPAWSDEPECTFFGGLDYLVFIIDFVSQNSDYFFRIREHRR